MDVIVGTPGRVKDHLEKGTLDLATRCKIAVLDEADQMLDMVLRASNMKLTCSPWFWLLLYSKDCEEAGMKGLVALQH